MSANLALAAKHLVLYCTIIDGGAAAIILQSIRASPRNRTSASNTVSYPYESIVGMTISDLLILLGFSWPLTLLIGLGDIKGWRGIVAAGLFVVSAVVFYFKYIKKGSQK